MAQCSIAQKVSTAYQKPGLNVVCMCSRWLAKLAKPLNCGGRLRSCPRKAQSSISGPHRWQQSNGLPPPFLAHVVSLLCNFQRLCPPCGMLP